MSGIKLGKLSPELPPEYPNEKTKADNLNQKHGKEGVVYEA